MRVVASVYPWALSLLFVTSCVVVTSLEAAEPSEAASAPNRHAGDLVQAAGVETGHHAELLVTNDTPLAVKPRRDLYSGSEDAQSSDTPDSGELPPSGDSAEQSPPSDGATNTASTSRSPAATETESSDEDAVDPRNVSSEASSDVPQTNPENQTPSEKTQPAEPDDNTTSVDATSALPVLEEVEQDDVESPIEPEDAPKANEKAASPLVTSPGSSAVDLSKVTSLTSSRDDSAAVVSSSPSQVASPPTSPAVDSSGPTQTNVPSADTADEGKERGAPSELHENTSVETDINNNTNGNLNNNDDSSENRNDKSNENNNSGNDDHDDNSSSEPDDITDEKITNKDDTAGGDDTAAGGDNTAAGGDDSAAATSSSEEGPGDSEEDPGDSEEDSGDESAPGVHRSPPRTVNGTVLEAGPGPWDSPADRARRRNVTTFALVMCGIVGATFVILVGMWINRMRHRDRLRSLQDHDDEEFTVFSASEARYITNSSGGGYEPLR